jgi:hypothetical protein
MFYNKIKNMKSIPIINKVLKNAKKIAKQNKANIIQSHQLIRSDRELLLKTNWIQEIIKGWYILINPAEQQNTSTIWYANFWDFLRLYLKSRFDNKYCLSAENSLDLHTNSTIIPKQVIVIVTHGGSGKSLDLLFDTSVLIYSDEKSIPKKTDSVKDLKVMSLSFAICKVSPMYFKSNSQDAEIALLSINDTSELSSIIVENNFKKAAERIVGAYLFLKKEKFANAIQKNISLYGLEVTPINPFTTQEPLLLNIKTKSPYANRIYALWQEYRKDIIDIFPSPMKNFQSLEKIEDLYEQDAYNSLSIEGYLVSEKNIREAEQSKFYSNEHNALAARGYFLAFKEVEASIKKIIRGENPGEVFDLDLQEWFFSLFSPSINAGIITPKDLVGYRKNQVFIRNSRHVPLPKEAIIDAMDALFDCLKNEENAAVRAILGHYIFVYIHPYSDGNGRLGRLLMNAMFVSGKYPWIIIHMKNRTEYMNALELTGINRDIKPFVHFIKNEFNSLYFL